MAKTREYTVSLTPATHSDGVISMSLSDMANAPKHPVVAASFAELEREVRRLAKEFGATCVPFIRLKDRDARKPAGFDAFTNTLRVIDYDGEVP